MGVEISEHRVEIHIHNYILEWIVSDKLDGHAKRISSRKRHRLLAQGVQERNRADRCKPFASLSNIHGIYRWKRETKLLVFCDNSLRRTAGNHSTVIEQQRPIAQILDCTQVVRNKHDGLARPLQFSHAVDALRLKICIADREHFVEQKNISLELRCNCKSQSQIHSGGIALDGCIDKRSHASKLNDARKLGSDLGASHAKQRTVQINVFASGQLGMKSRCHFDQS